MQADMHRERPLFDIAIHVCVQQDNREQKQAELTLRVLTGHRGVSMGASGREKVLRIEVCNLLLVALGG